MEEEYINIEEIFGKVKKSLWLVIFLPIIIMSLVSVYSYKYTTNQYITSTTIYIGSDNSNEEESTKIGDLRFGDTIIGDYKELIKQRLVLNRVIRELNLEKRLTVGSLKRMISVNSKSNTRFLEISVVSFNPILARDVANKTAEVFSATVTEVMDLQNVKVIDEALLPSTPISTNISKNILTGALFGIMMAIGIIFLKEYFNNSITTKKDVKKQLGVPVLTCIPLVKIRRNERV
jgi:capsular polysaccharide biosynthesis protein